MNEKDRKLAHDIAWARAENNCTNGLEERIVTALTTVRQEVWRAAIQIAKEEAFERRLAHTVYERLLEAAANSVKDSEDAQT